MCRVPKQIILIIIMMIIVIITVITCSYRTIQYIIYYYASLYYIHYLCRVCRKINVWNNIIILYMWINTGKPFFPGGPAGPCKTHYKHWCRSVFFFHVRSWCKNTARVKSSSRWHHRRRRHCRRGRRYTTDTRQRRRPTHGYVRQYNDDNYYRHSGNRLRLRHSAAHAWRSLRLRSDKYANRSPPRAYDTILSSSRYEANLR